MAHLHRPLISGQTYFIVVENKTGGPGFYDDACMQFYQKRLLNCLNNYQVKLHSYLLQEDEVWLLVTPQTPFGLYAFLEFLNLSYSEYFNLRFDRSIRVWRKNYRCSLIQGRRLALDCQKFIENYPMHKGLVTHPGIYQWSSYCANSFGGKPRYLTPHTAYSVMLKNENRSLADYREFVATPFNPSYHHYLKNRIRLGLPLAKRRHQMVRPVARKKIMLEFA